MKYVKKPIEIEAWLWDESKETLKVIGCGYMRYDGHKDRPDECTSLGIATLEGTMRVEKGDYIIRGVKGEFYPCKPDIFALTYDKLEQEQIKK